MATANSTFGFTSSTAPSESSRHIVITGAAGTIGSACAAYFLRDHHTITGLDLQAAPENFSRVSGYRHFTVDVADGDRLTEIASTVAPTHHLVIVAGGALQGEKTTDDILVTPEVFADSVAANLTTAYTTLHAFLPSLRAAGGNRSVTLISSINAVGPYGLPAYSAAKAGLSGLKNALAVPFGAEGIRINCVLPGTVPTARTVREWGHVPGHFNKMAAGIPLGQLGTPEDIASVVFHTAISMTHVHGVDIPVDGGQRLRG